MHRAATKASTRESPLQGSTLWLTGLPAAGKTTVAQAIERRLRERGDIAIVLDGDVLRGGLSSDLGHSRADRCEQSRRTAHVAALLAREGFVAIVALVSPYIEDRRLARQIHESEGLSFSEIWIDTPLRICEERDPKGLYRRARSGELEGMTGVDAPYEAPTEFELRIFAQDQTPEAAVEGVLDVLHGTLMPRSLSSVSASRAK